MCRRSVEKREVRDGGGDLEVLLHVEGSPSLHVHGERPLVHANLVVEGPGHGPGSEPVGGRCEGEQGAGDLCSHAVGVEPIYVNVFSYLIDNF